MRAASLHSGLPELAWWRCVEVLVRAVAAVRRRRGGDVGANRTEGNGVDSVSRGLWAGKQGVRV